MVPVVDVGRHCVLSRLLQIDVHFIEVCFFCSFKMLLKLLCARSGHVQQCRLLVRMVKE